MFQPVNPRTQWQVRREASIPVPSLLARALVFRTSHRKVWGKTSTGKDHLQREELLPVSVRETRQFAGLNINSRHHEVGRIVIQAVQIDELCQGLTKRRGIIDTGGHGW